MEPNNTIALLEDVNLWISRKAVKEDDDDFFRRPYAQETIKESQTNLLVYDPNLEVISQWIS